MSPRIDYFLSIWIRFFTVLFLVGFSIIVGRAVVIYEDAAENPFYGPTQTSAWLCDPKTPDCSHHIEPPGMVFTATEGSTFPLGRTICARKLTDATIYKEIDNDHGGTWPISGYTGSGVRDLVPGCQDRISPTVLFPDEPNSVLSSPPPGPGYKFRVWFNINRGGLPPLILPLLEIKLTLLPPEKALP